MAAALNLTDPIGISENESHAIIARYTAVYRLPEDVAYRSMLRKMN